jgi:acetyltransferase-like isoleucine patch superfamily enzyme
MVNTRSDQHQRAKSLFVLPVRLWLSATAKVRKSLRQLVSHAYLAEQLKFKLPTSSVVLGRTQVFGTGAIKVGENCFFYPDIHLETQGDATIVVGDGVVISRGVHLVAMSNITIGRGTMIGEYSSVRDANHRRQTGVTIRDAGHIAKPIVLGEEVWIGRGVTILPGVTIGDGATVGANAVVTKDVMAGTTVVGVPARPMGATSATSEV